MFKIEDLTIVKAPIERCFDLARSVEVHLAGNVHWGEEAVAAAGVTSGLVGLGQRVTWRARHFGIRHTLTSEITAMDRPGLFSGRHDSRPLPVYEARSLLSRAVRRGNGDEGCIRI
jgi:hypothetical protein